MRETEKRVSLTLDDGPNGRATDNVLDVLRTYQIRATFFLIGKNVEREPHRARRIVDEGHEVGNHAYDDFLLPLGSSERIRHSLVRTNRIIEQATDRRPRFFRPPYGVMTDRLQAVCASLDLTTIGVHAFVGDSFLTSPSWMASLILRALRGRSGIVVLHDGFGTYRAPYRSAVGSALERIIPELNRARLSMGNARYLRPESVNTLAMDGRVATLLFNHNGNQIVRTVFQGDSHAANYHDLMRERTIVEQGDNGEFRVSSYTQVRTPLHPLSQNAQDFLEKWHIAG